MKFYLDTANLASIKKYNAMGLVDGITTNPSLIVKEGGEFEDMIRAICKEVYPNPVSAEVVATDYEGMVAEGKRNKAWAENVVVKIPMIPEGMRATKTLSSMGIPINMTLIFSAVQGLVAAKAGASYISPFIGRLDDIGQDGMGVIRDLVDDQEQPELQLQGRDTGRQHQAPDTRARGCQTRGRHRHDAR